jgi:hypothetical protein
VGAETILGERREIARRRTEKERAEAFFPLRATTTAADPLRDARAETIQCSLIARAGVLRRSEQTRSSFANDDEVGGL